MGRFSAISNPWNFEPLFLRPLLFVAEGRVSSPGGIYTSERYSLVSTIIDILCRASELPAMQPTITSGTILQSRYRIVQLLGHGGYWAYLPGRRTLAEFDEKCCRQRV